MIQTHEGKLTDIEIKVDDVVMSFTAFREIVSDYDHGDYMTPPYERVISDDTTIDMVEILLEDKNVDITDYFHSHPLHSQFKAKLEDALDSVMVRS